MQIRSAPEIVREKAVAYRPLEGKTVLFAVSGGIAAYKAADYCRELQGLGARIIPVMTKNATEFVSPLTFTSLTGEKAYCDLFELAHAEEIPHIRLARKADLFLVLPATANIIGKAANAIADDLVTTLLLAYSGPALFFPSMNPAMYAHAGMQANLQRLKDIGYGVVEPESGDTACGESGQGRLVGWPIVRETVLKALTPQTLKGMTVLVSAGPTREPIDPVRFISNRSSGLMGFSMAAIAYRRGARVLLVHGPVAQCPTRDIEYHPVETAQEMQKKMQDLAPESDVVVMTAAVADYTPSVRAEQKIKKGASKLTLELTQTPDILAGLVKERRDGQVIVGFCAETEDLEEHALKKVKAKGVDLLVANDVSRADAGFDVATNRVIMVSRNEAFERLPLLYKEAVAERVWDRIERLVRGSFL